MLSSFTNKKTDKDAVTSNVAPGAPVMNATAPATMPPPVPMRATMPGRPGDRAAPSIIGTDLTILGNLVSKGEVQVDGEVQGDLHGSHIVVGEKARITGGIVAEEVVVRGKVMGSIRGRKVILQSSSHVEGDIYHQSLAIEQGAFFEGKSRRAEDPLSGVKRPDGPMPMGDAPPVMG